VTSPDNDREKFLAAQKSLEYVRDGMVLGLGSGSTARHFVELLGQRISAGLKVKCVPSSETTRGWAEEAGATLTSLDDSPWIDLTIDGADEADAQLNLIKGGGGALLREKIVAAASERLVIIADSTKLVAQLGKFPLPIEVIPFAQRPVLQHLQALHGSPQLRLGEDGGPFVTDEGNHILDCAFDQIADPPSLAASLSNIPGIVEHGLFVGYADVLLIGRGEQVDVIEVNED